MADRSVSVRANSYVFKCSMLSLILKDQGERGTTQEALRYFIPHHTDKRFSIIPPQFP